MPSALRLTIANQTRQKIETRRLRRKLLGAMKVLGIERAEWTITIVGDRAMGELHGRTMNDPGTTDVLTFDLREAREIKKTREGAAVELDTVLCVDEAARRAKELRHGVDEELLLYAIHSLLHVQGYDDVTARGAARMHRREDALLIALGIGPVYAAEEHEPARIPT
ncbi:MAG TPA: rRNA maturation RNase YbeY [Phycisphaerae bacterium]|nr:rRNA maturation RNase YbeY [Phycisphaerae bacterium]